MPVETVAPLTVESPSGNNILMFFTNEEGEVGYTVAHSGKVVIDSSYLSFDFKDMDAIKSGLEVSNSSSKSVTETWEMPWGEQRKVKNNFNELTVDLKEQEGLERKLTVIFRVYDDGLGFRYHFPNQPNMKEVIITDENTQFNLTGDHMVWWIPGDWDIYEHLYNETKFSEIDAISKRNHPNLAQTYIPENAVNTPVTMKTDDGLYLSFHEANLTDYSGMTLKVDTETLGMESELVGSEITGYKVKRNTPFSTPWRTIQIADKAGDLIESRLIVNLNEPNKLGDVSWFKPTKYVGIWWEMHLGKSTWDMASGKHGATTENAKAFIDFAAANNIGAVLVEGWNTGWEHWIGFEDREGVFDFVTPYEDYDLKEVVRYGKEKGVEIIMHHETSAAPRTYEQQLDTAYKLMENLGMHAVKTGYVGKIIPKGEYHHGQWMVNHYRKVLETAAKHKVAVNAHEPIKPTGIRRTLPNAISREGLRGQEFNAWSVEGGNPPSHLPTVAFTRMLAGPIDYTPGIFNIKLNPWKENSQVNTTLAQQLALYVVIYGPVQMAADLPENYEGNAAFQFIRDVGVDWEESKVLNGEVGDYVTIARRERNTHKWFIGSITDENPRELTVDLSFLDNGQSYTATIYADAADAHWDDNPTAYEITSKTVTSKDKLDLKLAPGGGAAISLVPVAK
ncbi:glycoside hydrolase family 97 protein [Fulvivirga ulvae]|uniref:glycoside hydrolase family 97 protein n=1 Tax=Fulvivirga ulvae TaxID=2904245 RepID=UPI001F32727F|nr:glycoside hydrolase family 97 protein [Fulvivirga ulvae]UII33287.1 glycoside hydrolase family 97 protein [Fulvivirga ulvae]